MTQPVLAVETGGTKIVWRLANAAGAVLDEGRFPTGRPEDAVEALVAAVADRQVAALGVASFGPVVADPASDDYGRMLPTPKPGWAGFNLARTLSQRLDAPYGVDTDVNAAARITV